MRRVGQIWAALDTRARLLGVCACAHMNGRDGALRVYADFVFELVPKTKADRAFVFAATSAADQERCGSFFFGRGWIL